MSLLQTSAVTPSDAPRAIARRVAEVLAPGDVVNLGIGIPTLVADCLDPDSGVTLQTENGMLGVGPSPVPGQEDPDLVNAGKQPVSELPGASYFSSAQSFGMIRGGHVHVAVLGALQVDAQGRIANWSLPDQPILGVGGAMDLLAGVQTVIVAMTHLTKAGAPKLVERCTAPLTGTRRVDVVVTEHATFVADEEGLALVELTEGTSLEWLVAHTADHRDRRADAAALLARVRMRRESARRPAA